MVDRPPASLRDLEQHLQHVGQNPQTKLDERLLDKFEAQLTEPNLPPLIPSLLPLALLTLRDLQQDPEPLATLILRLLAPLSFSEALPFGGSSSALIEALTAEAPSVNLLAVSLLNKAIESSGDVAIVAGMKDVVLHLVATYLLTPDTGVSAKIGETIDAYLQVDLQRGASASVDVDMSDTDDLKVRRSDGQGLMWRRVFEDRDVYGQFYQLTSPKTAGQLSKVQISLAQSRLLELVQSMAKLDFGTVARSHYPDIETPYGLKSGEEGLLDYAAVYMIDFKDDVLIHMTIIDFYTDLLKSASGSPSLSSSHPSASLDFLVSRGLHERTIGYYLRSTPSDPLEPSLLAGRSALYFSTYAETYPQHLEAAKVPNSEQSLVSQILSHIAANLELSHAKRWHDGPAHDLHILASLPRHSLLPPTQESTSPSSGARSFWEKSPLSVIDVQGSHQEYLKTLAVLFHGSPDSTSNDEIVFPASAPPKSSKIHNNTIDSSASRLLYLLYLDKNPNLFDKIVATAETIVLTEPALAAITLIAAIITARWPKDTTINTVVPSSSASNSDPITLTSESQLLALLSPAIRTAIPSTGIEAILTPPALQTVIPYLCSQPQSFTNLVGGRGDAESAAYRVAVAKFDALQKLHRGLQDLEPAFGAFTDVKAAVRQAVARGPWGHTGGASGSVATVQL
ncbi:MAG: hypothetical protein M1825_005115 [Sarcosagium campestre]|nr:MAG: hypothetical protein M1825_005115 [Sarcosagium campestre]